MAVPQANEMALADMHNDLNLGLISYNGKTDLTSASCSQTSTLVALSHIHVHTHTDNK